jgi:hypothetical protein
VHGTEYLSRNRPNESSELRVRVMSTAARNVQLQANTHHVSLYFRSRNGNTFMESATPLANPAYAGTPSSERYAHRLTGLVSIPNRVRDWRDFPHTLQDGANRFSHQSLSRSISERCVGFTLPLSLLNSIKKCS